MSQKIIQVVDSHSYVAGNCFQHQLQKTLHRETDCATLALDELKNVKHIDGTILLCLKLRSLKRDMQQLKNVLGTRPVFIYEQDPWENFGDDASCTGTYERACDELNVQSFLTPTKWWSDFINSKNIPSRFVKMWVLPEYCSNGSSSSLRAPSIGLLGQIHPWRKMGLDALSSLGCNVEIVKTQPIYAKYLEEVGKMTTFLHDEPPHFRLNGEKIPCNSMWGKEVEVMSQGTFCFRNREDEAEAYGLRKNPLLLEFSLYEEIIQKLNETLAIPHEKRDEMISAGVKMIKEDMGWKTVIQAMK